MALSATDGDGGEEGSTLAERAYARLRADILSGRLAPGAALRMEALKTSYGWGATPIREALSRLASEGLVAGQAHRGFWTAPLREDELEEVMELRSLLEGQALERSVTRGDLEWETAVVSAFHRLSRAALPAHAGGSMDGWEIAHRQFHRALIAACASPWLLRFCDQLTDQTERYRRLRHALSADAARLARDVEAEHRALMEAALARDGERARDLLRAHFNRTAEIIRGGIASGPSGPTTL